MKQPSRRSAVLRAMGHMINPDSEVAAMPRSALIAVLSLAVLFGCHDDDAEAPDISIETVRSTQARDTSSNVPAGDLQQLVADNNAFALDLYRTVASSGQNFFHSPYSISLALAMTYGGAGGQTETQMASTLQFSLPQARLHPAFNALDLDLASRGADAAGQDGGEFRLNIVNAIWGQKGYPFLDSYLDLLAVNYGAGLNVLDFTAEPEPSRLTINDWVSRQTEQRIQDLLSPGSITSGTRLVLTNAIYFNAAWDSPFEESDTRDADFLLIDGGTVSVPMMRQEAYYRYADVTGVKVVELPYDGREVAMVVLLPELGQFDAFRAGLNATTLSSYLAALQYTNLRLGVPRFTVQTDLPLSEALAGMGMTDAFLPSLADFSGMDGTRNLSIMRVVHKAFVTVNEAGTEAAAATGAVVGATSVPPPPVPVDLDRPFVFLILDIPTGAILFLGDVVNPVE